MSQRAFILFSSCHGFIFLLLCVLGGRSLSQHYLMHQTPSPLLCPKELDELFLEFSE